MSIAPSLRKDRDSNMELLRIVAMLMFLIQWQ